MKKWNLWTKNQKIALTSGLSILIIGGGTQLYTTNYHKQLVKEAQINLKTENQTMDKLARKIETLRDSKNPNFLAKEVTIENISHIQQQVDQIKKTHHSYSYKEVMSEDKIVTTQIDIMDKDAKVLAWQLENQVAVNQLFVSANPVIARSEVVKDLSIIDDLKIEKIEKIVKATKNKEMLTLIPKTTDEKNNWELTMTILTDQAKEQVDHIETTTQLVDSFYNKENKPIDTTDTKKIKEAENQIKVIKNEKSKKELQEKLTAVLKVVEEKQKNEAEKKAKEIGGTVKQQEDGSFEVVNAETRTYNETVTDSNNNYSASNDESGNQVDSNSGTSNNEGQSSINSSGGYDNSNNHTWFGVSENNGGTTIGVIGGYPNELPGIEFHYPD